MLLMPLPPCGKSPRALAAIRHYLLCKLGILPNSCMSFVETATVEPLPSLFVHFFLALSALPSWLPLVCPSPLFLPGLWLPTHSRTRSSNAQWQYWGQECRLWGCRWPGKGLSAESLFSSLGSEGTRSSCSWAAALFPQQA